MTTTAAAGPRRTEQRTPPTRWPLVPAPTVLDDAQTFATYLTNVIFREHLQQIPDPALQETFIAELTHQAAADDPPFSLDYWRLNMRRVRPV